MLRCLAMLRCFSPPLLLHMTHVGSSLHTLTPTSLKCAKIACKDAVEMQSRLHAKMQSTPAVLKAMASHIRVVLSAPPTGVMLSSSAPPTGVMLS